jgi:hypothetical protein
MNNKQNWLRRVRLGASRTVIVKATKKFFPITCRDLVSPEGSVRKLLRNVSLGVVEHYSATSTKTSERELKEFRSLLLAAMRRELASYSEASREKLKAARTVDGRSLARKIKGLRLELSKVETYRYGSFTKGRPDWEKRWDASPVPVLQIPGDSLPQAALERLGLPQEAVPVSKLESCAHLPASELAEAERKLG